MECSNIYGNNHNTTICGIKYKMFVIECISKVIIDLVFNFFV